MTVSVAVDRELILGGFRMTEAYRSLSEAFSTETLDARSGRSKTMIKAPGLLGFGASGEALWEGGADKIDAALWDLQRVDGVPFTLAVEDGDVGGPTHTVLASLASHNIQGEHGGLVLLDFGLMASSTPFHGTLMVNDDAITGSAVNGTAIQLGAVTATQRVQAALHVCGGTGAVTVKVQSDSAQAFTSPTDRVTFTTVPNGTPTAYEWSGADGAITDTWWRVRVENANASASRDIAVSAAII